jgi:hypothetical protein
LLPNGLYQSHDRALIEYVVNSRLVVLLPQRAALTPLGLIPYPPNIRFINHASDINNIVYEKKKSFMLKQSKSIIPFLFNPWVSPEYPVVLFPDYRRFSFLES